jgi:hypothetical protein
MPKGDELKIISKLKYSTTLFIQNTFKQESNTNDIELIAFFIQNKRCKYQALFFITYRYMLYIVQLHCTISLLYWQY